MPGTLQGRSSSLTDHGRLLQGPHQLMRWQRHGLLLLQHAQQQAAPLLFCLVAGRRRRGLLQAVASSRPTTVAALLVGADVRLVPELAAGVAEPLELGAVDLHGRGPVGGVAREGVAVAEGGAGQKLAKVLAREADVVQVELAALSGGGLLDDVGDGASLQVELAADSLLHLQAQPLGVLVLDLPCCEDFSKLRHQHAELPGVVSEVAGLVAQVVELSHGLGLAIGLGVPQADEGAELGEGGRLGVAGVAGVGHVGALVRLWQQEAGNLDARAVFSDVVVVEVGLDGQLEVAQKVAATVPCPWGLDLGQALYRPGQVEARSIALLQLGQALVDALLGRQLGLLWRWTWGLILGEWRWSDFDLGHVG